MNIFRINDKDNVAIALCDLNEGDIVDFLGEKIEIKEPVKKGHKIALCEIKKGEDVIKYGYPIGILKEDIKKGCHIHSHNLKTKLCGTLEYEFKKKSCGNIYEFRDLKFKGYIRKDGNAGIRQDLFIVPLVGCVNGVADKIKEKFLTMSDFKLDDIKVLKHPYGCSQLGDDLMYTQKILSSIVKHPNAAGVLVLGLGCENNTMDSFKKVLGEFDDERVKFLVCQDVLNEVDEGAKILEQLYEKALKDERVEVPAEKLKIGMKCGGSDAFSGITANPLVGRISDFIVAQGGTSILSEVPEMFGAENILMQRAKDEKVFNKIVEMINGFKEYFISYNQPVYENPSPGNKEGGITTLEEKSLGNVQKGGNSEVVDVLRYGERAVESGLNLLFAPGNDLVSSTALAAAGCQIVLFTTGRGTPYGTLVPTVKISTNSELFNKKSNWIDFNAGDLLEGKTLEDKTKELIDFIFDVANGKKTNNEKNGFSEIAIFKNGVTL
ncbi:altronate dehydratase [Caloramator sp. E03]|uniref:UxaA family hydrolase n=1 Tax=Caloramator sp. E03 TaxID=2576307 RepID=UPI0011104C14|nr:altronate dehydratase family protein [Caloramator sp. E03]QCX32890.1 altronate dehydratase [Caloramator sp. E03]